MPASPPDRAVDLRLLKAARSGDRLALEDLLRRHHDRLYAVCRRMAGNDADAQDACQEALIAVVRGLDRFDGRSSFSTWAYRVATNACLDELRRRARRPEPVMPEDSGLELGSVPGGGALVGSRDETEGVAGALDIDAALARLPTDFRAAVVLRDLCDLSYEEIGGILGIPPGTVRSRIARGRAALVPMLSATPEPGPGSPEPGPGTPEPGPAGPGPGNLRPDGERPRGRT